ncbi:MAG: phosphate ABC transporter substrate-binding/OmpA family protein [Planctomycetaceae bacterium]
MAGKPTPAFYLAVFAVIAGLVGFAIYRADIFAPEAVKEETEEIDADVLGGGTGGSGEVTAEAQDASGGVTTKKEYTYVPSDRLPAVKGTAAYEPLEDNTVKFAINVWAGWAPIILANEGLAPGKVWKTSDGKEFKLDLQLIDDPVAMRDVYAAGKVHIGWATLDMVPLFMEGFVDANGKPKDSRVMPRIFQQVDWSNGGDGIVVRKNIKTVKDLKGKKIALAKNSPSEYFLLRMLVAGGLQPSQVEMVTLTDAFEAAAAFNSRKDIAACVSWAPDIYNLSELDENRMLVTTATANKLIADVWFARADFAKDHPDLCEGIVRGIFDGMEAMKTTEGKQKAAKLMADGYAIPADETLAMLADAHSTNWAENYQFFLNQNNPARFEKVWEQAYYVYRRTRSIRHRPVPFDQVMDFSIIKKLGGEEKYSSSKDEYQVSFAPKTSEAIRGAEDEILSNTVIIHFYPNSWDLRKTLTKDENGKKVEVLYDPNVDNVLDKIAELVSQFGAARVIIEGHTDSSMKRELPDDTLVKELSGNRAKSVKQALLKKFKSIGEDRINTEGMGWAHPYDVNDPNNHAKNRRVEVRIFSAEAGD